MNTKVVLAASLVLNALLVGVEAYLLKREASDLSTLPPLIVCVGPVAPDGAGPPVVSAEPVTNVFRHQNWRRVESENYAQYVARLRKLGCPEKTVGDIVAADVNDMFHRRSQPGIYTASRFAP